MKYILISIIVLISAHHSPLLYERDWIYHSPGGWRATKWKLSVESTFDRDTLIEIDDEYKVEFMYTQYSSCELNCSYNYNRWKK